MIITLKGCTASAHIGGLNFYSVTKGTVGGGVNVTITTSTISKDAAASSSARQIATVALNSGYENLTVTVTMGGTTVSWYSNGVVTIPANTTVTGNIKISASATVINTGGGTVDPEPEEPGTGGEEIKTTIGTTNYETTIVSSWSDVILTPEAIISTSGGSNCTVNTASSGRCSNIDYVLQVNGGETLSFTATDLVESWALTEFYALPLTKANFTSGGDASRSWLTGNATLQAATKYIIINFKKKGTGSFSESDMEAVKSTITIN